MKRTFGSFAAWCLAWTVMSIYGLSFTQADERNTAIGYLPTTTVAVAEFEEVSRFAKWIDESAIKDRLSEIPEVQDAWQSMPSRRLRGAVALMEDELGLKPLELLQRITAQGVTVAFDGETKGAVIMIQASDEQVLADLISSIHGIVDAYVLEAGRESPIEEISYRDVPVFQVKDQYYAQHGSWLIITNKSPLGQFVLDHMLDAGDDTLLQTDSFQSAWTTRKSGSEGWLYINIPLLREHQVPDNLWTELSDNPARELIVGGVLETLRGADYVTANLNMQSDEVSIEFQMPRLSSEEEVYLEYFFSSDEDQAAVLPWQLPTNMLTLSMHRNLDKLFQEADKLFTEEVTAKITEADSKLSLFLSGKDISSEILPKLKSAWQVIVAQPNFTEEDELVPDLKLPTGAIVAEIEDGEELAKPLKIAFQMAVTLTNLKAGQDGHPLLSLSSETKGDATIVSAEYVYDEGDESLKPGMLRYNLSPTLVIMSDYLMMSSSKEMAEKLLDAKPETPEHLPVNTHLHIETSQWLKMMEDQRDYLISQNMLEKGHSEEKAQEEVGTFLDLMSLFGDADMKWYRSEEHMHMGFRLELKSE